MRVLLFGPLQDVAGWRERTLASPPPSLAALKAALGRDDIALGQALDRPGVQTAVDKAIVRGDIPLSVDAEVAFLPPMSGG
jgi:molybdopterin synthase sulfur carrier subunit